MILADSSIWIDHFRLSNAVLSDLLAQGRILSHPFLTGELALGSLKNRMDVIRSLCELPQAVTASEAEVLLLIERFRIFGRGVGYVDAHLLASILLTPGSSLWTRDRRLHMIADELNLATTLPGTTLG